MMEFTEKIKRTWTECEIEVDKTLPIINETLRQFDEKERPQIIVLSISDMKEQINKIRERCLMNSYDYENISHLLQHAKNFITINRRLAYNDIIDVKRNILYIKSTQKLLNILEK